MNKIILMGRLTADPEVRYSQGQEQTAIARYRLAVNRRFANRNDPNAHTADFIGCVAFGKQGEFAEKYLHKGDMIAVVGRIQTGSYTNRDNQKVYTTDVVVEEHYFTGSKSDAAGSTGNAASAQQTGHYEQQRMDSGFVNVPDGDFGELPFGD